MKKVFMLEDLDCAHCAQKMEDGISKIEGVISARVNFLSQKLTLEAPDELFDDILTNAVAIVKKIEPDCTVIVK